MLEHYEKDTKRNCSSIDVCVKSDYTREKMIVGSQKVPNRGNEAITTFSTLANIGATKHVVEFEHIEYVGIIMQRE